MTAPRALPAPALSEAAFQQQVTELATICGWTWLHVRKSIGRRQGKAAWQTTTNLKGWCDLLLWRPGRIVAAELKSDKGKTTPEQDDVLASLRAAGVDTYVWRPANWGDIARVLGARP